MKTFSYYWEKFSGVGISIVLSSILFFINWKTDFFKDFKIEGLFFDKVIDVSSTIFGFFLAILALIVQGTYAVVEKMKAHQNFIRLINFHKKVTCLCLIVCIYTLVLLAMPVSIIEKFSFYFYLAHFFLDVWLSLDGYRFLRIFYKIAIS